MNDAPPNINEIGQELWHLAGEDTSLGAMLTRAKEMSGGRLVWVLSAFTNAFDLNLGDVRNMVEPWQGWPNCEHGKSSEELEIQHGPRVRAARRQQPRHFSWTRDPEGKAWRGHG